MIEKLSAMFLRFPGIGRRQAARFVYFLLHQDKEFVNELTKAIGALQNEIASCTDCGRFFVGKENQKDICPTCDDASRDQKLLMIVEKDVEYENVERAGIYKGRYFVLGGTIPILENNDTTHIRIETLLSLIKKLKPKEIVLALSATPEGENTQQFVLGEIKSATKDAKITTLGRGLSTGTELEYSDADTLKSALTNRR